MGVAGKDEAGRTVAGERESGQMETIFSGGEGIKVLVAEIKIDRGI